MLIRASRIILASFSFPAPVRAEIVALARSAVNAQDVVFVTDMGAFSKQIRKARPLAERRSKDRPLYAVGNDTMTARKKSTDGKYWVCECESANGGHIIQSDYTGCIDCNAFKSDCAEIVVPSGLGAVFQAQLLEAKKEGCRVQVINSQHGFDAMKPFVVPFEKIERRS